MLLRTRLPLLLTLVAGLAGGASGCAVWDEAAKGLVKAQEEAAQDIADGFKMRMELLRYCERMGVLPAIEISDYERLRAVFREARPEVWTDEVLNGPHATALRWTHGRVEFQLKNAGMSGAARAFSRRVRKAVKYATPGYEKDLHAVLSQVLELDESNPCSRAYLAAFYSRWVYDLEPLSLLKIEGIEVPGGAVLPGPAKVRSVGRRGWIGLGRARSAGEIDAILAKLERPEEFRNPDDEQVVDPSPEQKPAPARRSPQEIRWVVDLRGNRVWSAEERGAIAASLERGWKVGKIEEIWVGQGDEASVQDLTSLFANWPVRVLCRREISLGGGKVAARVTLTCGGELLRGSLRSRPIPGEEGDFLKSQAARWDWDDREEEGAPAPSAGAGTP